MEPDISTLPKTGHFYFALTPRVEQGESLLGVAYGPLDNPLTTSLQRGRFSSVSRGELGILAREEWLNACKAK